MDIKIVGRHLHIYEKVKEYANAKLERLNRYYDQIQHIELTLSTDGDDKVAEIRIKARVGGQFVGEVRHEDFYAAIDLLVDKMSRQLKKQKEKLKLRHHKSGRREHIPAPPESAQDEEDLESYDEVIEKMEL